MAAPERFRKPRRPTPGQQLHALRALGLPGAAGRLTHHGLRFQFDATPIPGARTYRVGLAVAADGHAETHVLSPNLFELAAPRRPEHLYPPLQHPAKLCLFRPGRGEFTVDDLVAESLVPWAIAWLFYFEVWLACGEWHGGGEHPSCEAIPPSYRERLEARSRARRLDTLRPRLQVRPECESR